MASMTEKDHAISDRIQSKENTDRNKDPETKTTLKANKPRSRPLCCLSFDSPLQMKRDTKISLAFSQWLVTKTLVSEWSMTATAATLVYSKGERQKPQNILEVL